MSGSALSTDVGGRIFMDQAPEGCEFPYVVVLIVSSVSEQTFTDQMEDSYLQFSLFSASDGMTEITTMYADLKTLLDDCTFAITSNTLIWFKRQNLVTMMEDITTPSGTATVRHWAVDYSILTAPA